MFITWGSGMKCRGRVLASHTRGPDAVPRAAIVVIMKLMGHTLLEKLLHSPV